MEQYERTVASEEIRINRTVDYRFILWGINENKAVNILNNSVLEYECVL